MLSLSIQKSFNWMHIFSRYLFWKLRASTWATLNSSLPSTKSWSSSCFPPLLIPILHTCIPSPCSGQTSTWCHWLCRAFFGVLSDWQHQGNGIFLSFFVVHGPRAAKQTARALKEKYAQFFQRSISFKPTLATTFLKLPKAHRHQSIKGIPWTTEL